MKTVGFAGLGRIGLPMARNLLGKDWDALVYDVRDEPCTELAAHGAQVAASPAELAGRCQYIGVCVRNDDEIQAFLGGQQGLLSGADASSGLIVSLHSTISPAALRSAAEQAAKVGIHVIDAPISGGVTGATNAALTIMVGGDVEVVERARPVLATSGRAVVHCGDLGTGMAAKLCNNLLGYAAYTAGTEAVLLARASGLDLERLVEVTTASGMMTPPLEEWSRTRHGLEDGPAPAEVADLMLHSIILAQKDLKLTLELASEVGVDLPNVEHVRERIEHTFGANTPGVGNSG